MGTPRRRHAGFGDTSCSRFFILKSKVDADVATSGATTSIRSSSLSDLPQAECAVQNDNTPERKRKRKSTNFVQSNDGRFSISYAASCNCNCSTSQILCGSGGNNKRRAQIIGLIAVCGCMALLFFVRIERIPFLSEFSLTDEKRLRSIRSKCATPRIVGFASLDDVAIKIDFSRDFFPNTKRDRRKRYKRIRIPYTRDRRTSDDFVVPEELEHGSCKAMYPWQLTTYPSCNLLFEHSHLQYDKFVKKRIKSINHGFFRDVWKLNHNFFGLGEGPKHVVMKTLRMSQGFHAYNVDRHRRDAVAMERLTSSPHIVNIYGFCGNSQLTEYSSEGDIHDVVFSEMFDKMSPRTKLTIAREMASAIEEVHTYGDEGTTMTSMAHTDISPQQFIRIDGVYKLNDFNRVRFIPRNEKTGQSCSYRVANNPGVFRSPEEYEYEAQTEKVDMYSFGNVLYVLLTGLWPWDELASESRDSQDHEVVAIRSVIAGKRPTIVPSYLKSSKSVEIQALLKAMELCWIHDPKKRASASQIAELFDEASKHLKISI